MSNVALAYVLKGKPIFPVGRNKKPLVVWKTYQETLPTEDEVKNWWNQWPDANIGMTTGRLSGVVVIDCDSEESADRFVKQYPEAKDTTTVQTGRGRHYIFKYEEGIRNDAGNLLGAGIDIRGQGGFVIIPPSIHANGKKYQWMNKAEASPLPLKLKEFLIQSSRGKKVAQPIDEKIPEHQRNTTLASIGGTMRRRGMSEGSILAALREENITKCNPPLEESEVAGIAKSLARYAPSGNRLTAEQIVEEDPANSFPHYRKEPVRKEIKLQTWEEFIENTPEERKYAIDGILPDSGLAVLLGRGKHGKSTMAIHASRSIGFGMDFLGRATQKRPVVYVNYEMAEDYLQTLLWSKDCPAEAYVISRPEPTLTLETLENIMGQVENGPGLMVIDSFRGAFKLRGEAENLSGGAGVILRNLQDLAASRDWVFLLIHHSNRGGREGTDSVSGTSDWIAAPDVLWSWFRPDPDKSGTLIFEGRIPPTEPMAVKLSLEECSYVGTLKEDQEERGKEIVLAALSEEGQTSEDIARAVQIPSGTVRKRLDSLCKEGFVDRVGNGKRGSPYIYLKILSARVNPLGAETNLDISGENRHANYHQETSFRVTNDDPVKATLELIPGSKVRGG